VGGGLVLSLGEWSNVIAIRRHKAEQTMCRHAGISVEEIRSGTRRRPVSVLRAEISKRLFMQYGLPMADIARRTGITTSAVSKTLKNISVS
jgi:DNA-binding MarR family transcriptional regulator